MDLAKEETSNLRKAFWLLRSKSENNNSSSLSLLFFFRQIMTLKSLWKILFISSKILFFVLKIFEFLYFLLPIFSSCQSLIEKVIEYLMLSSTAQAIIYFEKESRETWSIYRVLKKEHFYRKSLGKICTKS